MLEFVVRDRDRARTVSDVKPVRNREIANYLLSLC